MAEVSWAHWALNNPLPAQIQTIHFHHSSLTHLLICFCVFQWPSSWVPKHLHYVLLLPEVATIQQHRWVYAVSCSASIAVATLTGHLPLSMTHYEVLTMFYHSAMPKASLMAFNSTNGLNSPCPSAVSVTCHVYSIQELSTFGVLLRYDMTNQWIYSYAFYFMVVHDTVGALQHSAQNPTMPKKVCVDFLLVGGDIALILLLSSTGIWQPPSYHFIPKKWMSCTSPLTLLCFMVKLALRKIWTIVFPFSKTCFDVLPHTITTSMYCMNFGASSYSIKVWISPWQMGLSFHPWNSPLQVHWAPIQMKANCVLCSATEGI